MATTFGKKLKELREEKGWGLREFSEMTGVSHAHIHNIEIGKRVSPKPETWHKLLKPFNLTYGDFVALASNTGIKIYPVISLVRCSFEDLMDASDKGFPSGYSDEFEAGPSCGDPNAFIVTATGKSMIEKGISEGDMLLVTPNLEFEDNKPNLVIFDDDGKRTSTVKITKRDGDLIRLTSAAFPKWEERVVDLKEKNVIIYRIYYIMHKN